MLKELKYLFFLSTISLFIFLTLNYYFSDINIKNSYRSFKLVDEKILDYSKNLILLRNNTNDIFDYVGKTINKNKKKYNFLELIDNNE
jgi:hypothetical protein|tara:strand:+ start:651 stop:914 length:264 start_codon:yes stop_codon:yes gene_type:complete